MLELIWKGIVGGGLTVLIVWLSWRGDTLPGILPLFPTFAIIALVVVGAKGEAAGFKEAAWAGVKTIPAYLAFLAVCILAVNYVDYRLSIAAGLLAWMAVAGLMFWGTKLV